MNTSENQNQANENNNIPIVNKNDKVEIPFEKYIEFLTNEVTTKSIKNLMWIITAISTILVLIGIKGYISISNLNDKYETADNLFTAKAEEYDKLIIESKNIVDSMRLDQASSSELNERLLDEYNKYMTEMFRTFIGNLKTTIELQTETNDLKDISANQIKLFNKRDKKIEDRLFKQEYDILVITDTINKKYEDFENKLNEEFNEFTEQLTRSEYLILSQLAPAAISRLVDVKISYKDKSLNNSEKIKRLKIERRIEGKGFEEIMSIDNLKKDDKVIFSVDSTDYELTLLQIYSSLGSTDYITLHIEKRK